MVFEALLRYYDLLSHSEQLCSSKQKRLRKGLGLAKQKLIFYLSYIKEGLWQPDLLGCQDFVEMFVSKQMFERLH